MAASIITFEKSLQKRLEEFMEVLCTRGQPIPASRILNEWRFNVELILEPTGWQALWKVSRKKCEELSITFPTIILVEVENVNFSNLVASVKIVAVQDDINIPANDDVPLQDLYPTKQQKIVHLDVEGTADCLDQLRFFYLHVWYPWDIDESDTSDWVQEHLVTRLQLHYDMRAGIVSRETGEHIYSLIVEGRKIQSDIDALVEDSNDDDDEMEEDAARSLMQLEMRKEQIKSEVMMLENPVTRNLMIDKNVEKTVAKRHMSNGEAVNSNEVCLVWLGGSVPEFIQILEQAKNYVESNVFVKSLQLAQDALNQAAPGDTLLLCGGSHAMRCLGGLECGGSIRGIPAPSPAAAAPAVLTALEPAFNLLDFSAAPASPLVLENVTVDSSTVQTAFLVRGGLVRLVDCRLVRGGRPGTSQGLLVLDGGKLVAENCDFEGMGTAVTLIRGAEATLTNCRVTKCSLGFKVNEESSLVLNQCKVTGCTANAIRIESFNEDRTIDVCKTWSVDQLKGQTNITLEGTVIEGSTQEDIIMVNTNHMDDMFDDVISQHSI